jgi:uncharacterized protein YifE (UPF0438 family)
VIVSKQFADSDKGPSGVAAKGANTSVSAAVLEGSGEVIKKGVAGQAGRHSAEEDESDRLTFGGEIRGTGVQWEGL